MRIQEELMNLQMVDQHPVPLVVRIGRIRLETQRFVPLLQILMTLANVERQTHSKTMIPEM